MKDWQFYHQKLVTTAIIAMGPFHNLPWQIVEPIPQVVCHFWGGTVRLTGYIDMLNRNPWNPSDLKSTKGLNIGLRCLVDTASFGELCDPTGDSTGNMCFSVRPPSPPETRFWVSQLASQIQNERLPIKSGLMNMWPWLGSNDHS